MIFSSCHSDDQREEESLEFLRAAQDDTMRIDSPADNS